ncbi:MAG: hypothetical protein CMH49_03170 [Myxococcales bacterium]|nr:hypothetical protein [Myxococcales bacterium]
MKLSTQKLSFCLFRLRVISLLTIVLGLTIMGGLDQLHAKRGKASASLRGSSRSVDRQVIAARRSGLKRYKSRQQVLRAIRKGHLKRVRPKHYLQLSNVSYPYAHPKLHSLLNRLGRLYYKHCRSPLVITSLTRPINEQPRNGSKRSVHPAGIAADLRVPPYACRKWLRNTLLSWETQGFIEATREKRPPHFHIVIIPHRLNTTRLAQLKATQQQGRKKRSKSSRYTKNKHANRYAKRRGQKTSRMTKTYRVRRGDSIWRLSRRWHVSEKAIKRINGLKSSHIELGQVLKIPNHG